MTPERPPAASRRGGAAIWIGVGLIAVLALALFGFAAEDPVDPEAPTAVIVDEG